MKTKLFIILFPTKSHLSKYWEGSFSERWLFQVQGAILLPPNLDTWTIIIRFCFWSPSIYVIWTSLILLETQVSLNKIFNMNRKVKLSKRRKRSCGDNQMNDSGWVQSFDSFSQWFQCPSGLSKLILMFASDLKTVLDMCNFSTFNFSMVPLPAFFFFFR